MILGLFWVLLLAAAVSGALRFFILTNRGKGLAKAMFYLLLCGAAATGFFWLVSLELSDDDAAAIRRMWG